MTQVEKARTTYTLALIAGILIAAGSLLRVFFIPAWTFPMMPMGGMMGMWWWPFPSILGLISGLMVIIGGMMLYNRPEERIGWGVLILLFSILGLTGGIIAIIGAIMGIVAGIMALVE